MRGCSHLFVLCLLSFSLYIHKCLGLRADEMTTVGVPLGPPASSRSSQTTLLIYETTKQLSFVTSFISFLKENGHSIVIEQYDSERIQLKEYGEFIFDNIIVISTKILEKKSSSSAGVALDDFLSFLDEGSRNILITPMPLSSKDIIISSGIRKLANECGIDFDQDKTVVLDYFHSGDFPWIVQTHELVDTTNLFTPPSEPILYEGMGMLLNPTSSFTFALLRGTSTSYSAFRSNPSESINLGKDVVLVSAMQARNGARAVFAASPTLLTDDVWKKSPASQKFAQEVSLWSTQQMGRLAFANVQHHKVGETAAPFMYRVSDWVDFSIDLWELRDSQWRPYIAQDVQLEFTMLDPYVRLFLSPPHNASSPTHFARFQLPDRYGVFKFVVQYQRKGLTTLRMETLAPVRNFKHNDYERFIFSASPYYGAVFVSFLCVLLLTPFYLYHKEENSQEIEEKEVELPASILTRRKSTETGGVKKR